MSSIVTKEPQLATADEQVKKEDVMDADTPSPVLFENELPTAEMQAPAEGSGNSECHEQADDHREHDEPTEEEPARRIRKVDTNLDWNGDFQYDAYKTSKLHSLIYDNKWDEALERVDQDEYVLPKENNSNLPHVSEIGFVDDTGRLPLHCALQFPDAPVGLISKLLKKGQRNFAKERQSSSNDLPLHIACSVGGTQALKILALLVAYPVAVWAESGDGKSTALNLLVEHSPDLHVVHALVDTAEKNKLELEKSVFLAADLEGQVPLHTAIQYQASTDVTMYLMESCSDSIYSVRNDGLLPLHVAAQHGCTKEVLNCLLQEYAAGVEKKADGRAYGNTPLHLLFHPEDSLLRWLSLLDDEDAPPDVLKPYEMVKMMLDAYYKHWVQTFGRAQDRPQKRKRNSDPNKRALDKVKSVLRTKNAQRWTVLENAEACLEGAGISSKELQDIVKEMQQIAKGKNVFE